MSASTTSASLRVTVELAADRLGLDPSQIDVIHSDTDVTPYSAYGTAASRSIAVGGGSAIKAAEQLATRLVALAATLLKVAPHEIVLYDGSAFSSEDPTKTVPIGQLGLAGVGHARRL